MSLAGALRPVRYGESLRERPRWIAVFIVLSLLYVMLGVAAGGDRAAVAARHLAPSAVPGARSAAADVIMEGTVVRSLFLPVRLFAGWSLFALVLFHACRIWKTRSGIRFAHALAAAVYAEAALFIGSAAAAVASSSAVASASAASASAGPPANQAPPWIPGGLDLLFPTADFVARYVLNSVNVFSVGYLALLAVVLSGATGLSRPKAAISALLAWAAAIFANAAIFHALRTEFHFFI